MLRQEQYRQSTLWVEALHHLSGGSLVNSEQLQREQAEI